jgi:hypothetical protein
MRVCVCVDDLPDGHHAGVVCQHGVRNPHLFGLSSSSADSKTVATMTVSHDSGQLAGPLCIEYAENGGPRLCQWFLNKHFLLHFSFS